MKNRSRLVRFKRSILLAIGFWCIRQARPPAWSELTASLADWNSDEDTIYDNALRGGRSQ